MFSRLLSFLLIFSGISFLVLLLGRCKEDPAHSANEYMHRNKFEELVRRFEDPARDAWQKPDAVVQRLGDLQGKTVVDIGAGTGYFSVRLARAGARVVALDVNDSFLDYLRDRKQKESLAGLEVRKTGTDRPAIENAEADLIFLTNVYHHIENRSDYFRAARAGLKPGGKLVVVDFKKEGDIPVGPPPHHRLSLAAARSELEAAGYTKFETDTELLPYQYILIASF